MKIKILGNGGAISEGLPYNSFLVEDKYLIETPPDIMNSLFRENIDISKIQLIYISHFHGDHYFGLPLLLLRLFFNSINNQINSFIKIFGPKGIKNKTKEICILAVGENHPLHQWIEIGLVFFEIISQEDIQIDNELVLRPFSMFHFIETWGFSLHNKNMIIFSYFADTIWDVALLDQIKLLPKVIITDLNGEPSDPVKVHLSENDIIKNALPVSNGNVVFYGTHLKHQKESLNKYIKYTHPGEEIVL